MDANEKKSFSELSFSVMTLSTYLIIGGLLFRFMLTNLAPFLANSDFNLANLGTCLQGFALVSLVLFTTWQWIDIAFTNLEDVADLLYTRALCK